MQHNLKSEVRETELRLEAKIEATKADIVKWMFGTIGFQTIPILGAVIALARFAKPRRGSPRPSGPFGEVPPQQHQGRHDGGPDEEAEQAETLHAAEDAEQHP